MGITYPVARFVLQEHRHRPISGKVLLIGRQTVTLTPEQATQLIQAEGIPLRPHAKVEIDETTIGSAGRGYITDRCFFSLFADCETLALDVSDYEGAEIICNLNDEVPKSLHGQFDFMLNGSCLDNLFDPASALKNMSRLLGPGGRVVHIEHGSPIQSAYVMYSPAMFFDYYAINRFADCHILTCLFDQIADPWNVFEWAPYTETPSGWLPSPHMLPQWRNVVLLVVAQKGVDSTSDMTPIQAFYRTAHGTDSDDYFRAFEAFRRSTRAFRFGAGDEAAPPPVDPAFKFVGVLAPPATRAIMAIRNARSAAAEGRWSAAIEFFSAAIDADSTVGQPGLVFAERGNARAAAGDLDGAVGDYERAMAIAPDEPDHGQRRDAALAEKGRLARAPPRIRPAVEVGRPLLRRLAGRFPWIGKVARRLR